MSMAEKNAAAARERFDRSFERISKQVEATEREFKERIAALAWCRANGNPHTDEKAARLIAAAPELLEALGACLALLEMDDRYEGSECKDLARAAIAKAKGETQ